MFRLRKDNEIFDAIVMANAIAMMNHFHGKKFSTKMRFHHQPMLKYVSLTFSNLDVSRF